MKIITAIITLAFVSAAYTIFVIGHIENTTSTHFFTPQPAIHDYAR